MGTRTGAAGQPATGAAVDDVDGVVVLARPDQVVPRPGLELVGSGPGSDHVGPAAAPEIVVAATSADEVVSSAPVDVVAAGAAVDPAVAPAAVPIVAAAPAVEQVAPTANSGRAMSTAGLDRGQGACAGPGVPKRGISAGGLRGR